MPNNTVPRIGLAANIQLMNRPAISVSKRETPSWRRIGTKGSVAKSGYLVTCLRDLPRGVEA